MAIVIVFLAMGKTLFLFMAAVFSLIAPLGLPGDVLIKHLVVDVVLGSPARHDIAVEGINHLSGLKIRFQGLCSAVLFNFWEE